MGLVFLIFNFFINKISQGRKFVCGLAAAILNNCDNNIVKLLISFRSFIRHYCSRRLKSKVSEKLAGLTPKHEVRTGPAENMGTEGHRLMNYITCTLYL